MPGAAAARGATTRRWALSILTKVSEFVQSLTSNKANTDVPAGVDVQPPGDGAVPRPDREPMAGFEPERKS
jgi:hypothetical protein